MGTSLNATLLCSCACTTRLVVSPTVLRCMSNFLPVEENSSRMVTTSAASWVCFADAESMWPSSARCNPATAELSEASSSLSIWASDCFEDNISDSMDFCTVMVFLCMPISFLPEESSSFMVLTSMLNSERSFAVKNLCFTSSRRCSSTASLFWASSSSKAATCANVSSVSMEEEALLCSWDSQYSLISASADVSSSLKVATSAAVKDVSTDGQFKCSALKWATAERSEASSPLTPATSASSRKHSSLKVAASMTSTARSPDAMLLCSTSWPRYSSTAERSAATSSLKAAICASFAEASSHAAALCISRALRSASISASPEDSFSLKRAISAAKRASSLDAEFLCSTTSLWCSSALKCSAASPSLKAAT
mmetsp:Transcript_54593/g.152322  ORF Transcript_54593/g.152322 Transcript_54593/m.152322 type:complete len:369 (+) Transcript_54593:773-1879(+)